MLFYFLQVSPAQQTFQKPFEIVETYFMNIIAQKIFVSQTRLREANILNISLLVKYLNLYIKLRHLFNVYISII